ncbi:MAG: flagellar hook-basal body protein [Gammaproteobacteria bacterium]|nr:flagellar hook-basal body protein [Gammaproteobacteria bacterium]MDH5800641.1 flagellar hook-basal body protein [Gammaproteobacteria bacterium]
MSDLIQIMEISMQNDMQRLNTISNNLANVNTEGFKKGIAVQNSFEATMLNTQQLNESYSERAAKAHKQRFIANVENLTDFSDGSVKNTGQPLHLAIAGDGMFEVMTDAGLAFTRKGSFSKDAKGRLVTLSGFPVQGQGGDIRLTTGSPRIDQEGNVWEGKSLVAQLKVVDVKNSRSLQSIGAGLYKASAGLTAGKPESYRIKQGYLENSNVSSMREMVELIETMRHFEASQKVISGYDSVLDTAIRTLGEF